MDEFVGDIMDALAKECGYCCIHLFPHQVVASLPAAAHNKMVSDRWDASANWVPGMQAFRLILPPSQDRSWDGNVVEKLHNAAHAITVLVCDGYFVIDQWVALDLCDPSFIDKASEYFAAKRLMDLATNPCLRSSNPVVVVRAQNGL